jgi:hypothetical protein
MMLAAGLVLAGCGGGHSLTTQNPAATVTLSPSPTATADLGAQVQFSVKELDAQGHNVFHTATFSSDNPNIDIANNGVACAGKWDSLTTPIVCTPASGPAVANITATASGVVSNTVTLYVHKHIDLITVTPSIAFPSCLSQTKTQQYTATAFSNGNDITSTVGGFTFLVNDPNIATINAADQPANQPLNQITATAKNPGETALVATAAGTSSLGTFFTTCGPATISLHVQSSTDTAFSIASGSTKQLAADVVDINGTAMTGVTLVYSSTAAAANATATGLVNGLSPGQASIIASCMPTSCNAGANVPVYSNPVTATITGTAPKANVYVTSTQFVSGPPPASPATTVVIPIATDTNTAGTAIPLPPLNGVQVIPNSILVSQGGSKVVIGSLQALCVIDTSSASVTEVTTAPGTVVSISPSATKVVVADGVNHVTYVVDIATSTIDTLQISGVTSVAWTPDGLKAYLVAGTNLYQYAPTILSLRTIAIGDTGEAVGMSPQFAYIGTASGNMGARSTCRNDSNYAPEGTVTTDTGKQFIAGVALVSGTSTAWKQLNVGGTKMTVDTPTITAPPANQMCPPGITDSAASADWTGSGIASFTPSQLIILPNGSQAYVLSDQSVLLGYDIAANTTFTVPVGGASQFTGGVLLSSGKVYFGGSDGTVHVIDTATKLQTSTITINFNGTVACAGTVCKPDLVVVQPR